MSDNWLLWVCFNGRQQPQLWGRDPRSSYDWKADIEPRSIGAPMEIAPAHVGKSIGQLAVLYPMPGGNPPPAAPAAAMAPVPPAPPRLDSSAEAAPSPLEFWS